MTYTASKEVPENVQVLFVQVENFAHIHMTSLASWCPRLGKSSPRFYVDEVHDVLNCHPERAPKWLTLGHQFSKAEVQMILMSGTIPPHRVESYVKPFGIKRVRSTKSGLRQTVRRSEIHVVQVEPIAARESLHHSFALYLTFWETTTACWCSLAPKVKQKISQERLGALCITRPLGSRKHKGVQPRPVGPRRIKGLRMDSLSTTKMMGRAGRDGKESHVFFVNDRHGASLFNTRKPARYINGLCMDGEHLALLCKETPGGVPCAHMFPNSPIQRLAEKAIENPFRELDAPVQTSSTAVGSNSALQGRTSARAAMPPGFVQASALLQRLQMSAEPPPARLQPRTAIHCMNASQKSHRLKPCAGCHGGHSWKACLRITTHTHQLYRNHPTESPQGWNFHLLHRFPAILVASCQEHVEWMQHVPVVFNAPPPQQIYANLEGTSVQLSLPSELNCSPQSYTSFGLRSLHLLFHCGMPQSRNYNGEEPACHSEFQWKKGRQMPFQWLYLQAVYCVWQVPGFRNLMIEDIGAGGRLSTFEEFLVWVVEENTEEGRYNNCIEAFLWFCGEMEKVKPGMFGV
ncbi:hypothetical protein DFH29DRAFT_1009413 [Suillus ampliporus]|nr:hypothetical protein DFH29DRAFT_1009413 [Suillus ampliporus]